jgi:hypothetical protein
LIAKALLYSPPRVPKSVMAGVAEAFPKMKSAEKSIVVTTIR